VMDTVPEAEEWLTIAAAARRLGVTPTAIRGRIERGTLEVKPNGNRGRLVRVPNPEGKGDERGDEKGSDRVSIPVAELLQLTARLVEAEKEAAAAPALRESVEALKTALEAERQLKSELRREVDRLSRPWWRRFTRAA
jgi:hypothetical protein